VFLLPCTIPAASRRLLPHLADLKSYLEADQRLCDSYRSTTAWAGKAILNVAGSGKFSSDRTIAEYTAEIWKAKPCPIS